MLYMYKIMSITYILFIFIINSSCFNVFSRRLCKPNRQFYLKDKFSPVFEEQTIKINHNNENFSKLEKSFFAQIGSNPRYTDDEDYHWFDGDGMIHGLFFNDTLITYQNKWIQTRRLQVEDKWKKKMYLYFGELKGLKGLYQIFKYSLMQALGFLPQAKGTANTALLNWKDRIFALHEGDMPYELNINYKDFNISTKKRINYPSIHSATAHPIKDRIRNRLYLYGYNNYDFSNGNFIFNELDENMNLLNQKNISLINNGMTHDVGFTGNHIVIPDMPLKYDVNRILNDKLPMYFDKENGETRFGIFNVDTQEEPKWYYFDDNFFIFHFSKSFKKNINEFVIFACVMENLFMEDFIEVDNIHNNDHIVRGNIRLKEININTKTNETKIIENKYIENLDLDFSYNIDFPIHSKLHTQHIYCSIFDSAKGYIKGYIRINMLDFEEHVPEIYLFEQDTYGNSEPQVVVIDNIEYLLTFTNDNSKNYISLIDMNTRKKENIEIPTRIPPGFHSIYYNI